MNSSDGGDLSGFSLADLFRMEVGARVNAMTEDLLALERDGGGTRLFEELMRGAHSLKGAAGMVDNEAVAAIAHGMEDCFVAAQHGRITLGRERVDLLLSGVDLLSRAAQAAEDDWAHWNTAHRGEVEAFLGALAASISLTEPSSPEAAVLTGTEAPGAEADPDETPEPEQEPKPEPQPVASASPLTPGSGPESQSLRAPVTEIPDAEEEKEKTVQTVPGGGTGETTGRFLRVTADNLNRLLAFTGETVVAARWVNTFAAGLPRLKRMQHALSQSLTGLGQLLTEFKADEDLQRRFTDIQRRAGDCLDLLTERLDELELFDGRFHNLSRRLYQEVIDCRMRPFSEGLQGFPRVVRDTARSLGKEVRLEIAGGSTPVDRDVLERVEAPLGHLLRNAVDHAIEPPAERLQAGKSAAGSVRIEARHSAGMLLIEVTDDGRGIDLESIRQAVVRKNLTTPELAAGLSEEELLEFLFLPGFTMKETVTRISGRGVGLDVVQAMLREVGGGARIFSRPGKGTRFQLKLPVTLSVLRTLLAEVGGEPYAFPLARITAVLKVPRGQIESVEGREHFRFGEHQVGLVTAHQILGVEGPLSSAEEVPVIVLGTQASRYGVVLDRLLGERELVVLPLDPRLGKIKDISAAALMPDQSPVLIVDVEDMIRSIEILVSGGRLAQVPRSGPAGGRRMRKRVLVVDDSLTVRELVRKFISNRGYEVEVAVDGMDGWNAVRTGSYDLVVTDVDMPRLDGIELVGLIKKDARLNSLPVMIVSYKDREEDRQRGLEAGADYYLTKSSFHDETLLQALQDLIGEAGV
ncbi:MAG: hybrid sensor histidine kinase/response regulator [Verrucomicrobiota bacterium]